MSVVLHPVDEAGDVILQLGGDPEVQVQVSSARLSAASRYFKILFEGGFKECDGFSQAAATGAPFYCPLRGSCPEAMVCLCYILHDQYGDEEWLSVDQLYGLSIVADKYDCIDLVSAFARRSCAEEIRKLIGAMAASGAQGIWSASRGPLHLEFLFATMNATNPFDEPVKKLLKLTTLLNLHHEFKQLFGSLVLAYEGNLRNLRPRGEYTKHDEVLFAASFAIEEGRRVIWDSLIMHLHQLMSEVLRRSDEARNQQAYWLLGVNNHPVAHGGSLGCLAFALKQTTLTQELHSKTGYPDPYRYLPSRPIQVTLGEIDMIMSAVDNLRVYDATTVMSTHDSQESCKACLISFSDLWKVKKQAIVDMSKRSSLICGYPPDRCPYCNNGAGD